MLVRTYTHCQFQLFTGGRRRINEAVTNGNEWRRDGWMSARKGGVVELKPAHYSTCCMTWNDSRFFPSPSSSLSPSWPLSLFLLSLHHTLFLHFFLSLYLSLSYSHWDVWPIWFLCKVFSNAESIHLHNYVKHFELPSVCNVLRK